jgi:hypothetical protein
MLKMIMYAHAIETQQEPTMAKNNPPGDGHRVDAVKSRSQTQTPAGDWVKRDTSTGRFMDVKTSSPTPFKGVRREKK